MGNIDLYFDCNPVQDWRALAEVRFTNAPLGQIVNYGGLAGQFERRTTEQYDPNASVPNAPMWGGYTVIERAYIEWSHYQAANVIVGYFFTPFGIWNVDHGSPTLLTMGLPQFIQQNSCPDDFTCTKTGRAKPGRRPWSDAPNALNESCARAGAGSAGVSPQAHALRRRARRPPSASVPCAAPARG